MTWLAGATLFLWLVLGLDWYRGMRRITQLTYVKATSDTYPTLSVIIPALNEARDIERSLRSVLAQDYPNLEVIVLNDRSTDRTGEILEGMKGRYRRLEVVHIDTLPSGWLGKNHALYVGAKRASGKWLLFTDADVRFEESALAVAVAYAQGRRLDHLAALPYLEAKSVPLKSFVSAFSLLFSIYSQPWRVDKPNSRWHIGIGAFNLLKKEVYEKVGTHQAIALRPDDDMKLGKLVKRAGYRQEAVFAPELMQVEWYTGLREAIRGLNKNAFAGLNYSLPLALLGVASLFVTNVFPFVAVFFAEGLARWLFALSVVIVFLVYAQNKRLSKLPVWYAALHPFGVTMVLYATLEAVAKALWRGSISWRGTRYSLSELRKNKV